MKNLSQLLLVGIISATLAVLSFNLFTKEKTTVIYKESEPKSALTNYNGTVMSTPNFVNAANKATSSVVHIQTSAKVKNPISRNPFFEFFGEQYGFDEIPQTGSGSGVIITADGYIVTNNHVIENADDIEVTLHNKKSFKAKLIGTDPSTDIAVIKIDAQDLNFITMGNSDHVQVGEWVMAVGNPFNLESTVTAGIVSAKGRNINLLRQKAGNIAIESFIQTDAAVNPGNSGGALVSLDAELIGINTAIATPTGTFAGYSFAVPSNLVNKVVDDIIDFGIVQRGYLGVSITDVNNELKEELKLQDLAGVYVAEIVAGSGADDAGIKSGDVVTHVNDVKVNSTSELQELVARYRPGDEINISLVRGKDKVEKTVTLKTQDNSTAYLKKEDVVISSSNLLANLGIEVEDLTPTQARKYGLNNGVVIKSIKNGLLSKNTDIKKGFVITKVNNSPVNSEEDLVKILEQSKGDGVLIEGKYPGIAGTQYYAFGM